jgi:hypothetical protein
MRDFKGMKRQRGRNRGGGGKPSGGGGGGGNNANRAFDSNGPDGVKIRGHAQHIYEKYQQLSRDAASAGDRVLLENYLQHAEHYYRLIRPCSRSAALRDHGPGQLHQRLRHRLRGRERRAARGCPGAGRPAGRLLRRR